MKLKIKNLFLNLLSDIGGSILYSAGIYTFAKMADFAPGGLSGLALMLNHIWGIPIGIMILLLNIPLIILSFKTVGKKFIAKTVRSMIFCIVFLDLIFPLTPFYTGNRFLAALYSGICLGAGLAVFYMRGSSSGGTDFLTITIKKLRPHFSIGMVTMSIDLVIILLGGIVYKNIDAVLYGLTSSFAASTVIDKIMYGIGSGKLTIIITTNGYEVSQYIGKTCSRGCTAIRATGTYTQYERDVLLCACSKSQAYSVRNAAHEIDKNAFVMITETSEVFGEGFIDLNKLQN